MLASDYQRLAMRTAVKQPLNERLVNASLGLAGESGEFADKIKKWLFHGHELPMDELSKELGDLQWYIAQACDALGVSLEDVMKQNIDKLKRRYPNGFSHENSRSREE